MNQNIFHLSECIQKCLQMAAIFVSDLDVLIVWYEEHSDNMYKFVLHDDVITKASDAELWCFLWCAPEQTAEQTLQTLVIWDAMTRIVTSL